MNNQKKDFNKKSKLYFSNKEIALVSTFLVMLLIGGCVWFAGPIIGISLYGIIWGIILITAAIIIGKKYTILALGIVYTLIDFTSASMYGGTLSALNTIAGVLVLEFFLILSEDYGLNLKLDLLGLVLLALVSRTVYVIIITWVYGMALPFYFALVYYILPHLITFPIGGFIGYKMGKRIKNTVGIL